MKFFKGLRLESVVFGLLLGAAATLVAITLYHEVRGFHHLSVWERNLERRNLEETGALMLRQVELATTAMDDGSPLPTSSFLAGELMGSLYSHHMDYAYTLLQAGDIERFNALRTATGYLVFNLSGRDLSGFTLRGANFLAANLAGANLSRSDLEGANLSLAELTGANLVGAHISHATFIETDLSDAILTGVHGTKPDFTRAVLVNTSITKVRELAGAVFRGAILSQANLWKSRFPDAVFDHADFTIASAVDADLGDVASMDDSILTGANLSGARLTPESMERTWFVNAEGLASKAVDELRGHGGVGREEHVFDLVDSRIVDGFRVQVEEDPEIRERERHAALMNMLQSYYLR